MKDAIVLILVILAVMAILSLQGCAAALECAKPTSVVDYHSDRHGIQLSCGSRPDA